MHGALADAQIDVVQLEGAELNFAPDAVTPAETASSDAGVVEGVEAGAEGVVAEQIAGVATLLTESNVGSAESGELTAEELSDGDVVTVTGTPSGWTLRQAVENLGISENTIRKRIKDGELHGFKVMGTNGPEWRISPPSGTVAAGPAKAPTEIVTVATGPTIEALLRVIDGQTKQLEVMTDQLRAATEVCNYQRVQLETRDAEIKLLADSQNTKSRLKRFLTWMITPRK